MAIIVTKPGVAAKRIDRAPVTAERDLQTYIVENPECLPMEQVGEDLRLLVLAREVATGAGPIDALGIDQEGHPYLIETKLYRNPDKRQVIAQMLDYGAALWAEFGHGGDFRALLERTAQTTLNRSLTQHIEERFEIEPDTVNELLATVAEHIAAGRFRFVVLMDRLDDRLKDLIAFVNANSQFTVYGLELEFYPHGVETIVIPTLYGSEVRKQPGMGTARRSWDEQTFFGQAGQLPPATLQAVRDLYEFSRTHATSVDWGTGSKSGSFNPKFDRVSEKSVFTVYTTGNLQVNFGWLNKSGGESFVAAFGARLRDAGFTIPRDFAARYMSVPAEQWVPRLAQLKQALLEAVEACRRSS